MNAEVAFRYQQVQTWAKAISTCRLNYQDVYLTCHKILLAMITYPMAVTTITTPTTSANANINRQNLEDQNEPQ